MGAANDRRQLRRIVGQVSVAAIAFLLTAVAWECAINHLHARPEIPEPFATKIERCFNSGNYDTLFIGSSRFFHGIDPAAFDAETAKLGTPTHSYNLGFDALDFHELQFVVRHVLTDPRLHIKTLFIEPSLRVRLAPGLEHSQRALTLHDETGSREVFEFLIKGNHDWKHKLFWLYEQAGVSAVRLTNVGALTNRYVRPQEPPPDLADLDGPEGGGYHPLDPNVLLGTPVTAQSIKDMMSDQTDAERSGTARQLNDFEIAQLNDLQKLAAQHGIKVILLAAPTAAAEVYGEFSAVKRASETGKLSAPFVSFADPITYFDLYDPKGFTDPDHIGKPTSKRWSIRVADEFAKLENNPKPVSEVFSSTVPLARGAGNPARRRYSVDTARAERSSSEEAAEDRSAQIDAGTFPRVCVKTHTMGETPMLLGGGQK
jgi:hypothetical protein